jgi:NAD(P)-dependent dehydrogenase (short-subunit alcohol dehydrogenase family)
MDPRGRIAVVTGAAGGIGGALVRALVDAGAATVVATDVRADDIESGDRVVARPLDVGDEAATVALVHEVEDAYGPIDLWFANAGIAVGGGADAPDERWESQWQVNVMAHVYAARALLPGWIARGEGHLVTTASMAGILTSLGDGVYAATKHAALGWPSGWRSPTPTRA